MLFWLAAAAVGFVHLYPVFSSVNLTRQWILNDLYVAEARKLGVGRALRNALTNSRGHAGQRLTWRPHRQFAAQKLYESLGWKRDDEFYRYCCRCDETSMRSNHSMQRLVNRRPPTNALRNPSGSWVSAIW